MIWGVEEDGKRKWKNGVVWKVEWLSGNEEDKACGGRRPGCVETTQDKHDKGGAGSRMPQLGWREREVPYVGE